MGHFFIIHPKQAWKSPMTVFEGSCLCKGISYSIKGDALGFYHCHCQRCRKVNGTGHGSNIRIDAQSIEWHGDKSLINRYKVPDAYRFRNDFCRDCGSPMPRYFEEVGYMCCQPEPWTMSRPCSRRLIFFMPRVLSGVVQKASQKQYLALILIQNNISKLFINNHL
ncbi:GFA family protein [Pseudomonadales bacterium]|nr:GFA family protein [Pseudomonadales bacterium]